MFFILFDPATPRLNARVARSAAGGTINCWIERPTMQEAIEAAQCGIAAEGWIVDEPEEVYPVDGDTYPPGKDGREYFEQALIDKEVFVFYTFPDAASDDTGE